MVSAATAKVDIVLVGGRVIKRGGRLTSTAVGATVEEAARTRDRTTREASANQR